jgi:hypothetical protein
VKETPMPTIGYVNSKEVVDAKINLYRQLLSKENHELTDLEIDIMYKLSQDRDVQSFLSAIFSKERG